MNIKIWFGSGRNLSLAEITSVFDRCVEAGISGVIFQYNPKTIETLLPYSQKMELQIWRVLLCENSPEIVENHPDWFMVNRQGESSRDFPAYVGYYRWLCPSKAPVREYLLSEIDRLCQYREISAIHLDYVRYPDVVLPIALPPTYNIIQEQELPEYDFCYCDDCCQQYRKLTGVDPLEIENPQNDARWLQFRYDNISSLVQILKEQIHSHGKNATAAVFPSPILARTLVRQDWDKWDLDEYYPMIYHDSYLQNLDWIEKISRFDRITLKPDLKIFSGFFMPAIKAEELYSTIESTMNTGIDGICLFDYNLTKVEHWEVIKRIQSE